MAEVLEEEESIQEIKDLGHIKAMKLLSSKQGLGFGFCGAHRTGKTTICDILARDNPDYPFVSADVTSIQKEMNFDFGKETDPIKILDFQEAVIDRLTAIYEKQTTYFFTDRTPADVAAYTLAHFDTRDYTDPEISQRIDRILAKCKDAMGKYFACVFCIQPGIAYVEEPNKPTYSASYQEKIAALCLGFAHPNTKNLYVMPRNTLDIHERVDLVTTKIGAHLANFVSLCEEHLTLQ